MPASAFLITRILFLALKEKTSLLEQYYSSVVHFLFKKQTKKQIII
jgi:hypothetical protein